MQISNLYLNYRSRRSRKKRLIKLIIYTFLGLIIVLLINNKFAKKDFVSPLIPKNKSLKNAVEYALFGTKGTYGIVVKNLKTGESYFSNEHKVFKAGSLYKLWVMDVVYQKIQEGKLKETEQLSQEVKVLNDKFKIASGTAELTEGAITLSVNDALLQMITISHNYAALLLTEKIKLSTVSEFLKTNEFKESKVGIDGEAPITTPFDITLFFEKLNKLELANQEYTNKMISLLQAQQNVKKLTKYLPSDIKIAHKTGELEWFTHDAGIVFSPFGDYIIVVLSESNLPLGAEEKIAEVSKAVYEYFSKQK